MTAQVPAPEPGDRVVLVDANNLVHRLYHASAPRFAPSDARTPINAVVAWAQRMRALRRRLDPRYLLAIFDAPGDSWRRALLPGYKLARKPTPDELAQQWPWIWDATVALQLPALRQDELEADDLIAAYARACVDAGLEITIVSNDRDLMQLIRGPATGPGSVRQFDPFTNRFTGPAEVEAKFGVRPERLADLLALAGDGADGIPGVPGIGLKIAAELLAEYGDLDGVLDNAALVRQRKRSERLLAHRDDARLSRTLVGLRDDAPLPRPLATIPPWRPSRRALDAFFARLGFASFEAAMDTPGDIPGDVPELP